MSTINEIAIRVRHLSKKYQKKDTQGKNEDFYALKDVSFDVKKGEMLGIIGKNGSGKSTLLKILSGVTKPTKGEIEISGTVASILDVGTGFHPDLSGRENVYLRGELLGMSREEIDAVFEEIVTFSEVKGFIETPVKHYSSGMFLRLAFSIIIHLKCDILLLDEVISVGDLSFQKKCFEKLNQLVLNKKITLLIVSHEVSKLTSLVSTLKLLKKGRLVHFNSRTEAFDLYLESKENTVSTEEIKHPVKISLHNENGQEKHKFINNEIIKIHIDNVLLSKEKPFVSLRLKDVFGNVVFISSPFFSKTHVDIPLDKTCNLSVEVPALTFNKGSFFIDIVYTNNDEILEIFDNVASFIVDLENRFDNIKIYGESGALKPYLLWKER